MSGAPWDIMNRSLASPNLNMTITGNGYETYHTNPFAGIQSNQRIPSEEDARDM